jgi:hypothetical protein
MLPWHSHLLSLNIDIHGSYLLSDFLIYFLPKLASNFLNMLLAFLCKNFLLQFYPNNFPVSLLRNHNSNLRNDYINKINVLPQHAIPSIMFNFSQTKTKYITRL